MQIKINGVTILFKSIESMHYEEDLNLLVVRTVSGKEHKKGVADEESANFTIERILQGIAMAGSI